MGAEGCLCHLPGRLCPGPLCVPPSLWDKGEGGLGHVSGARGAWILHLTTWLDFTSHLPRGPQAPVGTLGLGDVYAPHLSESEAHVGEGLAGTSLWAVQRGPPSGRLS